MSLSWNVAKVANSESVCWRIAETDQPGQYSKGDRLLNVATEALIFATMGVGFTSITEANHREFFARLAFVETISGGMRYGPAPDHARIKFTLAEVRSHIGLTTNAGNETPAKWLKRIGDNAMREALYIADRKERDAKESGA